MALRRPSLRTLAAPSLLAVAVSSGPAQAAPFEDRTASTIGATAGWSNKVRLADIDGDGDVDVLFANGAGYAAPGGPEMNAVFLNQTVEQGPNAPYVEAGAMIFGGTEDAARVVVARDLSGDGVLDLFVGTTWGTQSRLLLGQGGGAFVEVTDTHLPAVPAWIGDAEPGDVDGDGDLDLVLADWGGHPADASDGFVRLWRNEGDGVFVEATAEAMPDTVVGWSWELELLDADDDGDLDVAVSCKSCSGSKLYDNDGDGTFTDVTAGSMPQLGNNYEFEPMDVDGDGDLDLVTINDHGPGTRNGIFENQGGAFVDATDTRWPMADNPAGDDNMVAFVDVDSDGDPDFVVAGLAGQPDRLMLNDGSGVFAMDDAAFAPADSPGSLGIAVSDLDGDGRWDVVLAEGEVAFPDRVFLGVDVPVDTAPPVVAGVVVEEPTAQGLVRVRARIHDSKSPLEAHDLARTGVRVEPLFAGEATYDVPMAWFGEYLFRAEFVLDPPGRYALSVCAEDRRRNEACSDPVEVEVAGVGTTGGGSGGASSGSGGGASAGSVGSDGGGASGGTDGSSTSGAGAAEGSDGCGCASAGNAGPGPWWLVAFAAVRRRRSVLARRRARA